MTPGAADSSAMRFAGHPPRERGDAFDGVPGRDGIGNAARCTRHGQTARRMTREQCLLSRCVMSGLGSGCVKQQVFALWAIRIAHRVAASVAANPR